MVVVGWLVGGAELDVVTKHTVEEQRETRSQGGHQRIVSTVNSPSQTALASTSHHTLLINLYQVYSTGVV